MLVNTVTDIWNLRSSNLLQNKARPDSKFYFTFLHISSINIFEGTAISKFIGTVFLLRFTKTSSDFNFFQIPF